MKDIPKPAITNTELFLYFDIDPKAWDCAPANVKNAMKKAAENVLAHTEAWALEKYYPESWERYRKWTEERLEYPGWGKK